MTLPSGLRRWSPDVSRNNQGRYSTRAAAPAESGRHSKRSASKMSSVATSRLQVSKLHAAATSTESVDHLDLNEQPWVRRQPVRRGRQRGRVLVSDRHDAPRSRSCFGSRNRAVWSSSPSAPTCGPSASAHRVWTRLLSPLASCSADISDPSPYLPGHDRLRHRHRHHLHNTDGTETMTATPTLADGLHLIVKRDCPTCVLIEPAIAQLAATSQPLTVYSQDDPSFPESCRRRRRRQPFRLLASPD